MAIFVRTNGCTVAPYLTIWQQSCNRTCTCKCNETECCPDCVLYFHHCTYFDLFIFKERRKNNNYWGDMTLTAACNKQYIHFTRIKFTIISDRSVLLMYTLWLKKKDAFKSDIDTMVVGWKSYVCGFRTLLNLWVWENDALDKTTWRHKIHCRDP